MTRPTLWDTVLRGRHTCWSVTAWGGPGYPDRWAVWAPGRGVPAATFPTYAAAIADADRRARSYHQGGVV